jgi:hypothetical protein
MRVPIRFGAKGRGLTFSGKHFMRRVLKRDVICSISFTYSVIGRRADAKRIPRYFAQANFGVAELVPEGKGKFAKDSPVSS